MSQEAGVDKQSANPGTEPRRLGILEILTRIGEDNISVQWLNQAFVGADYSKKRGMEIKFATDAITALQLATDTQEVEGIILWVPKNAPWNVKEAWRKEGEK